MNDWAVYRQDFCGNEFLVEKGLTEQRARELVLEYESHKHHQHYWADKQPESKPDLKSIAQEMLAVGSSIRLIIPVLATYQFSHEQMIDALSECIELDVGEIAALVAELSPHRQSE